MTPKKDQLVVLHRALGDFVLDMSLANQGAGEVYSELVTQLYRQRQL